VDVEEITPCVKHQEMGLGAQFVCRDCAPIKTKAAPRESSGPREPHPDWVSETEIAVEDATVGMTARSTRSGAWCEEFVIGEIRVGKKNVTMLDEDGKIQLYLPIGTLL
jgi:hypothetical protein